MTTRPTAVQRVLGLVAKARGLSQGARNLSAMLDTPGLPPRFAERAADAAVLLEQLTVDLDAYFHGEGGR